MPSPFLQLNVFQRLMRQWTELAPYNAGTLLRIAGPADPERWRASIDTMVREIGLGRPVFLASDRVEFHPLPDCVLQLGTDLETETVRELNYCYGVDELPMRFFLCPAEDGSHWLGFMFDHWLTDGGTIAELVVRLVVRYAEPNADIGYPPHILNQLTLAEMFGDKVPSFAETGPVREAARVRGEHREVARFSPESMASFVTHFHHRPWPRELTDRLPGFARQWEASVHDLLLAMVAQLLAGGREDISLASVMDIRAEAVIPAEGRFGQFVSFYTNVIAFADQRPLEELTREIASKNRRIKEEGRALKNFGALEAARVGWDKEPSLAEKSRQFHQLAPIQAGVSHMKVTRLQREIGRAISRHRADQRGYRDSSPLLDATVVSPTGPLTPLLITVNKLHADSTMMGMSYRTAVYSRVQIEELASTLLNRLSRLVGLSESPG